MRIFVKDATLAATNNATQKSLKTIKKCHAGVRKNWKNTIYGYHFFPLGSFWVMKFLGSLLSMTSAGRDANELLRLKSGSGVNLDGDAHDVPVLFDK